MVVTVRALTRRLRHLHVPFNPSACQALAATPHFNEKATKVWRRVGQHQQKFTALQAFGDRPSLFCLEGHPVARFQHHHGVRSSTLRLMRTWSRGRQRQTVQRQQHSASDFLSGGAQTVQHGLTHGHMMSLRCISLPTVAWRASVRASRGQHRRCSNREVHLQRKGPGVHRTEWPLDCPP